MRKTKIVCTIGPSTLSKSKILGLYKKGMDIARINISHGNIDQYKKIIEIVRSVGEIPIMLDTQGPEVRTKKEVSFKKGEVIEIPLSVDVEGAVNKGTTVLFDDGLYSGRLISCSNNKIEVKMNISGTIRTMRKVVFKGAKRWLPILTNKDKEAIKLGLKENVEFLALSYVSSKEDVIRAKKAVKGKMKIVSKIESVEALKNLDKIIDESYGIMVARGDLGISIPSKEIPIVQKKIIRKCIHKGKPVIVATQMMESMIERNKPTRAETSDIANAIIDGADALMLSGETAIGRYPLECVKEMAAICNNTEEYMKEYGCKAEDIEGISSYAYMIAKENKAKIVCLTRSGYTARMVSRHRPKREIVAITPNKDTAMALKMSYGVVPIVYEKRDIKEVVRFCKKKGIVKKKDKIVMLAGLFKENTTNTIVVISAGDIE